MALIVFLLLASITLIIILTITTVYRNWFNYWKKRGLNYLEPTFPFGNAGPLYLGKCNIGQLFAFGYAEIKRRGWKHGGVYLFGKPIYIPVDNELVKKILVSDFLSFPNHGLYMEENADPMTGHIFNMDGYQWKNLRAKLPAAFTSAKLKGMVNVMAKISDNLTYLIDTYAENKVPINAKSILADFTQDTITACLFGIETNYLKDRNEELATISRVFFDHQWSRKNVTIALVMPKYILSAIKYKTVPPKATKYFTNMFQQIKDIRKNETVKRNDLTDILLDLYDDTKYIPDFNGQGRMPPLTLNELLAQMWVFFEAGFEPSSTTQTFALYEIARNETIQEKLREEICSVLEKHGGRVCYDSVNEMEYLDNVVNETVRMYPTLPALPRLCVKNYKIPGTNVVLEKNTFVIISNMGIQYDPEFYPDPTRFDPDRFSSENKSNRPFCSYLPFGEGPRICIGKRLGLWQIKICLISLVKNYKITLNEKTKQPIELDTAGFALSAKGGIWINFQKT